MKSTGEKTRRIAYMSFKLGSDSSVHQTEEIPSMEGNNPSVIQMISHHRSKTDYKETRGGRPACQSMSIMHRPRRCKVVQGGAGWCNAVAGGRRKRRASL